MNDEIRAALQLVRDIACHAKRNEGDVLAAVTNYPHSTQALLSLGNELNNCWHLYQQQLTECTLGMRLLREQVDMVYPKRDLTVIRRLSLSNPKQERA